MADYPLVMKAEGDGDFVVRCGMREETTPVLFFHMKCDSLGSSLLGYPEESGLYNIAYGSNHPASLISGKDSSAYRFKVGSTNYGICPITPAIDIAQSDFTVSFWGRSKSNSSYVVILNDNYSDGFVTIAIQGSTALFSMRKVSGGGNASIQPSIPLNKWRFITCVKKDQTIYIYISGVLKSSMSGVIYIPSATATDSYMLNTPLPNGIDKDVDDVKMWKQALTEQQILDLYNSY